MVENGINVQLSIEEYSFLMALKKSGKNQTKHTVFDVAIRVNGLQVEMGELEREGFYSFMGIKK